MIQCIYIMINRVQKGFSKFWATLTLLSLELLVVMGIFFAAFFAFLFLADMVFQTKDTGFDEAAFAFLSSRTTETNTAFMQLFSFLGTHFFLVPANILLVFYFLLIKKHRWYSIEIPVISLSSLLLMVLLKQFFARPRPLVPLLQSAYGLSFPSGHAMMSSAFYGLLIWLVFKSAITPWLKWLLIMLLAMLIISIGLSRVYLRVHYASDVLAGYSLGLMWLIISLWILQYVEKFNRKQIPALVSDEAASH